MPILCLDFDGVIHSYDSGWQGPRTISDPPVPGALEFIAKAADAFDLQIYSSRSKHWFGRWAMKRWLVRQYVDIGREYPEDPIPEWWADQVYKTWSMEPWDHEARRAGRAIIRKIAWPTSKPPALVTLDDRAVTFTGTWPEIDALKAFKPWNRT